MATCKVIRNKVDSIRQVGNLIAFPFLLTLIFLPLILAIVAAELSYNATEHRTSWIHLACSELYLVDPEAGKPHPVNLDRAKMNASQTGEVFIKIGPYGTTTGDEWDDGCLDGVREIFIWHDSEACSLQFVYDSDGQPVLSDKHGDEDGVNFDTIELEYPSEYLTGIRGQSWRFHGYLTSLMFFSNKRSFGPFGRWDDDREADFQWQVMGNKICGFFGRAQPSLLSAVGIHLRALPKTS